MINNDYSSSAGQVTDTQRYIYDLVLEEGTRQHRYGIAYRTSGLRNTMRENAMQTTAWLSGAGKVTEDEYLDPVHALDPNKYSSIERGKRNSSTTTCRRLRRGSAGTLYPRPMNRLGMNGPAQELVESNR